MRPLPTREQVAREVRREREEKIKALTREMLIQMAPVIVNLDGTFKPGLQRDDLIEALRVLAVSFHKSIEEAV